MNPAERAEYVIRCHRVTALGFFMGLWIVEAGEDWPLRTNARRGKVELLKDRGHET